MVTTRSQQALALRQNKKHATNTNTLRKLPAEVRLTIFKLALPKTGEMACAATPNLIVALRGDPMLYHEALEVLEKQYELRLFLAGMFEDDPSDRPYMNTTKTWIWLVHLPQNAVNTSCDLSLKTSSPTMDFKKSIAAERHMISTLASLNRSTGVLRSICLDFEPNSYRYTPTLNEAVAMAFELASFWVPKFGSIDEVEVSMKFEDVEDEFDHCIDDIDRVFGVKCETNCVNAACARAPPIPTIVYRWAAASGQVLVWDVNELIDCEKWGDLWA